MLTYQGLLEIADRRPGNISSCYKDESKVEGTIRYSKEALEKYFGMIWGCFANIRGIL